MECCRQPDNLYSQAAPATGTDEPTAHGVAFRPITNNQLRCTLLAARQDNGLNGLAQKPVAPKLYLLHRALLI
jgi:hypothetical protein